MAEKTGSVENEKLNVFNSYLKSIGLFIGTYGLAVFLVVYYAIKLYPELRDERGEWIKQITIIKQIVDPDTRPLTRIQANAIMDITISIYQERLQENYKLLSSGAGGVSRESDKKIKLWGNEYDFKDDSDKNHLENTLERFFSALEEKAIQERGNVTSAFDNSINEIESILYPLSRLKYGGSTLDDISDSAIEDIRNELTQNIDFSTLSVYESAVFREFIQKHPAYYSVPKDENKLLDKLKSVSDNSKPNLHSVMQKLFEKHISRYLDTIDNKTNHITIR